MKWNEADRTSQPTAKTRSSKPCKGNGPERHVPIGCLSKLVWIEIDLAKLSRLNVVTVYNFYHQCLQYIFIYDYSIHDIIELFSQPSIGLYSDDQSILFICLCSKHTQKTLLCTNHVYLHWSNPFLHNKYQRHFTLNMEWNTTGTEKNWQLF
jgi:hypothetical protein